MNSSKQRTLKSTAYFSGRGLFSGKEAEVFLRPAPEGTGIVFIRTDLPGMIPIPATLDYVRDATRCTLLQNGDVSVQTIEHLMAALRAFDIDNLFVEISNVEVPIFDGSSLFFTRLIQETGVVEQEGFKQVYKLSYPVSCSRGETHIVALPSDEFRISYTLHYPQSPYLRSQFFSYVLDPDTFVREIAPCRTFTLYEEIAPLIERGLFKGSGLDNGVVIKGSEVLNPEGVRFADEMVRHKILDVFGDLALVKKKFTAHVIALRSGHASNHALGHEIKRMLGAAP